MSSSESLRGSHAKIDRLLPWYVNGTLSEAERAEVELHLDLCEDCRRELARCRVTSRTLRESGGVAPQPHPAQLNRLMRRIDALGEPEEAPSPGRRLWGALARPFMGTPRPLRWAFAAQLALVALLGFLLLRPTPPPTHIASDSAPQAEFRTLSDSSGTATSNADQALLRVVFTEDLPERELREALLELRAEIVGGPSPFGVYTLAVPAKGAGAEPLDSLLEHLRARPGVQFAEVVKRGKAEATLGAKGTKGSSR